MNKRLFIFIFILLFVLIQTIHENRISAIHIFNIYPFVQQHTSLLERESSILKTELTYFFNNDICNWYLISFYSSLSCLVQ